jgi:uncharacterized protein (DUF885 family)
VTAPIDPVGFDALIDSWISDELENDPVIATFLGADGDHGSLGDYSAQAIVERQRGDAVWLERARDLDSSGLDPDQRIDLDLLVSGLRGRAIVRDRDLWRSDPSTYLNPCLNGLFMLFLNRVFPEPETVAYAVSRLQQVPSVVDQAMVNLEVDMANPLICERGLGQCRAAVGYFRDLLPREVEDESSRARLAEAGNIAAGAMETFAEFIGSLVAGGMGGYALGEERYSRLLEEKELLAYGAVELRRRGEEAWEQLDSEMEELARAVDPGANGWREVVESLNADHPATPEEMLASYTDWTERARRFLAENGLVTLPEAEQCIVEPSPAFQRPILAVASYVRPPAFRPSRTGHFFVPWPPDGTSPEDVQKRLASNSFHAIPTISVHEAYPGHHWHLTWMKANPRRLRHLIFTPYYSEGWALYAEKMMREQGFFEDPRAELSHLDARIFRAARIIVDTGLHIGDLGFEEAVEIMRTKASLSEPVARAEVGRYCAWPTQAPSYLTGSLEIERMRGRYMDAKRGDLRSFHDEICATGALPLGLAERALMGD